MNEGTPRFRDFLFSNITARGSKTAGQITGLKEMPIEKISFSNVRIQPQAGMKCTDAKDIAFLDVTIETQNGPALAQTNCRNVDTARLHTNERE